MSTNLKTEKPASKKPASNCMTISPAEFIDIKACGGEYSNEQLADFLADANNGLIDDGQLGSWLMAVRLKGMTPAETTALTIGMARSGKELNMTGFDGPVVDKHSTGGVGDKVTIIIAPLLAAAGLYMPKLSGKGLGHTGGTVDKLHAIPGFSCDLSVEAMISQARAIGLAIGAQTAELAPLDGRLYAMRDVTATVASIPLIAASVMSKKLAAGAPNIVLDVTCGKGAFMGNKKEAIQLTELMVSIGKQAGRKVSALVTDMDQPLGNAVGNALEIYEAIKVLSGDKSYADVREIVLELGALAMLEVGKAKDKETAKASLAQLLDNGKALDKFRQFVLAQGGNPNIVDEPSSLVDSSLLYKSAGIKRSGWVKKLDPMAIALASLELGGGRKRKDDKIDYAVGVRVKAKVGDHVKVGDSLIEVYARTAAGQALADQLENIAYELSDTPIEKPEMVLAKF